MESQVSIDSRELSTCSDVEALAAADRFLGDPDRWEPSLIAYRLRDEFQADWKAEVGRWLLLAEQLGFVEPLMNKLNRAFNDLRNPRRVSGANDSSHLLLAQEITAAMAVYYLTRSGWQFIEWEPARTAEFKGDVDIRLRCPHGHVTDFQVKAPDQPGERANSQVVDGEYNDRVLVAVGKGLKQIASAPGPQRVLLVSPQRLWATAERSLAIHLIGSTISREGRVTLTASDRGVFATEPGCNVGAVAHLHMPRGVDQVLYRCTVFLNPWAPDSARPIASAFSRARVCYLDNGRFRWDPEASGHCSVLPSDTEYLDG